MKKILFLFVALVMSVASAWAVVTPKASNATTKYYYKMHCAATSGHVGNWYINIVDGVLQGGAGATAQSTEGSLLEFVPTGVAGQWYLVDVASGKYLESKDNTGSSLVAEPTMYWTTTTQSDGIRLLCNGETGKYLNNNGGLAVRPGTGGCSSWVLEEEAKGIENALNSRSETLATSENLTSSKFYVISGYGQTGGDTHHFLYDNGGIFATATAFTTGEDDSSKFAWCLVKNSEGLWSFQNAYSGKFITFEGNSDDSPVTMSEAEHFYTIHWNSDGNIAAFKNSNGQGIDLAYWGTAASTWSDDGTVGGSRRMRIYEAEVTSTIINSYSYTVVVTGVAGGAVIYNGSNYANSAAIEDLDAPLTSDELAAAPVDGYNGFVTLNGSTITVHYLPAAPSLGDKEVGSVGEKVTAVEAGKWYLVTQTRGAGETPAYATNDNKLYRAAAANTVATVARQGRAASEISQYLVRFVDSDVEGAKYIQFANGKFWGSTNQSGNVKLDAALDHADKYIVYQIGTSSRVGFSQTTDGTTSGRKVDNDGAGNTVGYWNSGTVTSETDNAAWNLYPVVLVAPVPKATVTYNYNIDGVTVKSVSSEQNIGDVVAAPAVYAYTTNAYDTEAVVAAGGTTVDITVTVGELPFVVSSDFASATWQYWANAKYSAGESAHPYAYYDEAENFVPMAANLDGSDAFKWAFVGNPITGFKIMNKAAGDGKYLYIATASNGATPVMSETERTWELVEGSTTRSLPGTKPFTFVSDGKYINDYANNGKVSFWQDAPSADNGSNWAVFPETVDVTISGAQYATLYSQYPVEVPEGVKAYTLALNNETGYLTATEVTSVPARCGVVLEGDANNYKFAVKTAAAATSCLSGVFVETETPANCCTFAVEEGVPGFYKYTGKTVAANKAYYIASSDATSNLRISFGELTSIISAAKENGGQAIFDLQGRRVVNAQNGLFIQNGKKVIK